jgi:phage gp45-like
VGAGPATADGVVIDRDESVIIASADPKESRPSNEPGAVEIFHTDGSFVKLGKGKVSIETTGTLHIKCQNLGVGNGNTDLIQIVSELFSALENLVVDVPTGSPTGKINDATKDLITSAKTKWESYKASGGAN